MRTIILVSCTALLTGCVNLSNDELTLPELVFEQKTVYCDPVAETDQGVIVLCDDNKLMLEQDGEIVPIEDGQLELTSEGVRLK